PSAIGRQLTICTLMSMAMASSRLCCLGQLQISINHYSFGLSEMGRSSIHVPDRGARLPDMLAHPEHQAPQLRRSAPHARCLQRSCVPSVRLPVAIRAPYEGSRLIFTLDDAPATDRIRVSASGRVV